MIVKLDCDWRLLGPMFCGRWVTNFSAQQLCWNRSFISLDCSYLFFRSIFATDCRMLCDHLDQVRPMQCKHSISRSEQVLTCTGKCGGSYHITCTDLNDAQYENLKKDGRIETWTCTFCSIVLTASGSTVSNATALVPGANQVQTVSLTTDKLREIVSDIVMLQL